MLIAGRIGELCTYVFGHFLASEMRCWHMRVHVVFFFVRERFANLHLYSDGKDGARRMRMGQLGWLDKGKHYNKHT